MAESRLSIRIDEKTKKKADTVFRKLGLTMSSGITIYLNRVAQQQGIPFSVALPQYRSADAIEHQPGSVISDISGEGPSLEKDAKKAVRRAIRWAKAKGQPVALYVDKRKRPYLEYPDGRKEYKFNGQT
jgi:DNA-damage-inducible protein J